MKLGLGCFVVLAWVSGGAAAWAQSSSSNDDPAITRPLEDFESRFEAVAKSMAPAVVAVSGSSQAFDSSELFRTSELNPEILDKLLDRTSRMVGTGSIIHPDGYILTNAHVVDECENLWVTTDSGKVYSALRIGTDARADLAVIKIAAHNLPVVKFGEAEKLQRGKFVLAMGNPYGLATLGEMAITPGVVSAVGRSLPKLSKKENRLYTGLIQHSAQINPGNSGGPLFDLQGNLVGVNTAVVLPEKKAAGIGFSIPVDDHLKRIVAHLLRGEAVPYSYLGVAVSTPSAGERSRRGARDNHGVLIEEVDSKAPASPAFRAGDLVYRLNGRVVDDSDQFIRLAGDLPADQPLNADVYRNGKAEVVSFRAGARSPFAGTTKAGRTFRWQGLVLGERAEMKTMAESADGIQVIAVEARVQSAAAPLKVGSIIHSVAGQEIKNLIDFQELVAEKAFDYAALDTREPLPSAPLVQR